MDFREEINKYQPLIELDEIQDSIRLEEITDVTDLLRDVLSRIKAAAKPASHYREE